MEADDIEAFVASLTTEQKDQLWEIVQHWNEPARFVSSEIAEELENPSVASMLEAALDNSE